MFTKPISEIIARSCTDKRRFSTEQMALMDARRVLYRKMRPRKGARPQKRMWVYPCEFCAGWHLTSRLSGHACVEV